MKVLMIGWEFPPLISGGLGVACYSIAKALAEKKIDVTVILPQVVENCYAEDFTVVGCNALSANVDTEFWQKMFNIDVSKIDFSTFIHPYISAKEYVEKFGEGKLIEMLNMQAMQSGFHGLPSLSGKYGSNLFAEVLQYAIIAGAMAETIPHDVIHVHDWLTVLAGIEAKRRSKKPLVFHIHALEPDRSGTFLDERIFAIEKYGMEQADVVVAVSEYTKKVIIDKYGISPHKIEVVYNGTDLTDTNDIEPIIKKRNKMVLFLGRLAQQKGPHYFIELARKILARRKDVHFVIAGTGGLMPEIVESVAKHRLGRYIHFTGFLDKKRVKRIYRMADVYVMPSVSEPFGLSCLEALSHNVPVVISKQSGVSEVLHHVFKVDFWDIDQMANKVIALLDYKILRDVTLKATAKELKELTWDKTANVLINLYNRIFRGVKND